MDVKRIVSELDSEIARLQQIRAALTGIGGSAAAGKSDRGRPRGSTNASKAGNANAAKPVAAKKAKKRKLSAEGRKRISDAMKRRWTERRKEAAKKA